ncbi:MAG TPA: hypothetical protein VKU02_11620 [Gemmataceae bacterium]|nr:hypothetical protein [Gemmataceae bacterium]
MPSAEQVTRIYRELAEDYGRQGQAQMRDRFLVLAADAALAAGQQDEAERLRGRLLQHNPHHLLKPYSSFAEAMKSADVQNYVTALRRNHPYEKAENLLEGLRQSGTHAIPGSSTTPATRTNSGIESGLRPGAGNAEEDVKVFRVKPPPSGSSSAPARPIPPASSAPSARPASTPEILPLRREPYPALDKLRAVPAEREERDASTGAWVSTGLLFVLVLLGIALGLYTLIGPFLPQGWF